MRPRAPAKNGRSKNKRDKLQVVPSIRTKTRSTRRPDKQSKYGISIPVAAANKLGHRVALLYSDNDKALAIQKSATGDFKVRQIGKSKSARSVYCKGMIEAKKIKKGRYTTQWDEKDQMLIAKIT